MRRFCLLALSAACRHPAATPAAEPAASTTITVTLDGNGDPPMVAYRDGEGAWTELMPDAHTYSFAVASERYQVAWTCDLRGPTLVKVRALTVHDATALVIEPCAIHRPLARVRGTVSGRDPDLAAYAFATQFPTDVHEDGSFSKLRTWVGAAEVVVVEGSGTLRGTDPQWSTSRASITRTTLRKNESLVVDLADSGVLLEHREIAVVGARPDEVVTLRSRLETAHGAQPIFTFDDTSPYVADTLPSDVLEPGDRPRVSVTAVTGNSERFARGTGSELGLIEPLGEVSVDGADGILRLTWVRHADAASYELDIADRDWSSFVPRMFWIHVSAGWLGIEENLSFEVPTIDLPEWGDRALRFDGGFWWSVTAHDVPVPLALEPAAESHSAGRSGHTTAK